ncbi:hypothetical protein E4U21_006949 [Claviceps maximensis]|nr:hypothetical protein E4U21_006949 [Claviceps maximensis]
MAPQFTGGATEAEALGNDNCVKAGPVPAFFNADGTPSRSNNNDNDDDDDDKPWLPDPIQSALV